MLLLKVYLPQEIDYCEPGDLGGWAHHRQPQALLSLPLKQGCCGEPTCASSPPILDRVETHTVLTREVGRGAGTCSRRHLSTAHSTSHAALSLAYCCCSRSRACSSSRSSERKSSSRALRALKSCWFSTTCGNRAGLSYLIDCVSGMGNRGAQSVGSGTPAPAKSTGGRGLQSLNSGKMVPQ